MNIKHCIGQGGSGAGGAGNESYIELWNPATTGKDLKVKRIELNTADTVIIFKTHTAKQGSTAKSKADVNPALDSPDAEIYGDNAASVSGTTRITFTLTANTNRVVEFPDPIIIQPGYSFVLVNNTDDLAINEIIFYWDEVDQ